MENPKAGDIVVRKINVGESSLPTFVIQRISHSICAIVPFIELQYEKTSMLYKGSQFVTENRPKIIVHKNEIAGICCINSELADIFCRKEFLSLKEG